MTYTDLFLINQKKQVKQKAEEIGWNIPQKNIEINIIESETLEKIRNEIEKKEKALNIVKSQNKELNKKVADEKNVDVILSPTTRPPKSDLNYSLFKKLARNNIAIANTFQELNEHKIRYKANKLREWKQNYQIAEKTGTTYIITTFPKTKYDLRDPKNLAILLENHGISEKTIKQNQKDLIKGGDLNEG